MPIEVFGKGKSGCKACRNARQKARYQAKYKNDPEYMKRAKERAGRSYHNPENKEKIREYHQKRWPTIKEERQKYLREWHKNNPGYLAKQSADRRNKTRVPAWADLFELECVYKLCAAYRAIGLDMHVDHIVPIRGKTVCGLHTPDNLQILPASENIRKNNTTWPDKP